MSGLPGSQLPHFRTKPCSRIPNANPATQTSHRHRTLSLDPLLHRHRLQLASVTISHSLSRRPSLSSLHPPTSTIYLTATHVLARNLSRQLVSIRLNRNLSRRPSTSSLIKCNILPRECCSVDRDSGEWVVGGRGSIAPSIVNKQRMVERERIKDGLRAWLDKKAGAVTDKVRDEEGGRSVRGLVRRFTARWKADAPVEKGAKARQSWASGTEKRSKDPPTRAHVYGLRRFWEGLAKGQDVKG